MQTSSISMNWKQTRRTENSRSKGSPFSEMEFELIGAGFFVVYDRLTALTVPHTEPSETCPHRTWLWIVSAGCVSHAEFC
jgi:hypothetical protein